LKFTSGHKSGNLSCLFRFNTSFGVKSATDISLTLALLVLFKALFDYPLYSFNLVGLKGYFYLEVVFISGEKREWAISLLKEKSKELGRLPKKDDFDEVTRSRIKAYLGPWPRALEEAKLKEKRK